MEPQYEIAEDWVSVAPGLRSLDDRERAILRLRFFDGLTQSQIAQQVGISQMHVSRLIRRALEKSAPRSRNRNARSTTSSLTSYYTTVSDFTLVELDGTSLAVREWGDGDGKAPSSSGIRSGPRRAER